MPNRYRIQSVASSDESALWEMLMHAAHESSIPAVQKNPDLARYVSGWGRAGDLGVVALQEDRAVGAAWLRLWAEGDRGYGYIADEVPELAIAVVPPLRGQGIGTALLKQLLQTAKSQFSAVSLSTRADNPAVRLYRRMGFVLVLGSEILNREGGQSFNMLLNMPHS